MTDIDEALAPVLPRELTEISDSVRRVSAPPTPILAEPYRLRLVDPDTDMISEWMNRPHLVEAWEYDRPPARWHRYLCAQLDRQLAPVHRQLSRRATSVTSNSTGRQRIPSPRVKTLIRMTSVCTRPSRTSSSSTAVSDRCCCRASSRISSSSNPVAGESCSTPITATAVPGGCASSPVASSSASTTCRTAEWPSTRCGASRSSATPARTFLTARKFAEFSRGKERSAPDLREVSRRSPRHRRHSRVSTPLPQHLAGVKLRRAYPVGQ